MFNKFSIICLALTLSGCNYLGGEDGIFRNRGGNYLEALVLPPMAVPNELDSYTLDELYVIPLQVVANAEPFEGIPMPKPIETRRREGVRIQNLGDRRWVVIDATPSQVWPLIRDYWTQLEISLSNENPGTGIMETGWLELDSTPLMRHKYRIRIEPGLHSGYSEIYVVHLANLRSLPEPLIINWPEDSSSQDQESAILNSVSQYLADRNDIYQASTSSLLAGSIEAARKANLIEADSGEQILELRIDYDRAWVQIRQALERAEIDIVDSDRDLSFFNVRFAGLIEEVDEPGFIGRFFLGGSDAVVAVEQDFSLRLMRTESAVNVVAEFLELSGREDCSDVADDSEGDCNLTNELLQVIDLNLT